jgi:eukaryotic-like serine/threonine-protein kinase
MREPSPGDVLAEKYRLVSLLGRGGMGSVWRADHLVLRTPVALKLLRREILDQPDAHARFLREAQAAAALRSAHVVQILDFGVDHDNPFIVMELLEGESLRQRLRRNGRLAFEDTLRIVTHVTRALARAHERGIVHRDLKPDNVFLVPEVGEEQTKVLDFGVAKLVSESGVPALTDTGTAIGSPHYMSPEQARGTKTVDFRTDLWALGVIAFECIAGKRPFESEVFGDLLLRICTDPVPPASSIASVPPGFDEWCFRALAREPGARFGSAEEMAAALRSLGQSVAPHSIAPVPSSAAQLPPTVSLGPVQSTQTFSAPPKPKGTSGIWLVVALLSFLAVGVVVAGGVFAAYELTSSPEPPTTSALPSSSIPVVSGAPLLEDPVVPNSGAKPTKLGAPVTTPGTATTKPTTAATTASPTPKTANVCTTACARAHACGVTEPCNPAVCEGRVKNYANCINAAKSCVDAANCKF